MFRAVYLAKDLSLQRKGSCAVSVLCGKLDKNKLSAEVALITADCYDVKCCLPYIGNSQPSRA